MHLYKMDSYTHGFRTSPLMGEPTFWCQSKEQPIVWAVFHCDPLSLGLSLLSAAAIAPSLRPPLPCPPLSAVDCRDSTGLLTGVRGRGLLGFLPPADHNSRARDLMEKTTSSSGSAMADLEAMMEELGLKEDNVQNVVVEGDQLLEEATL